MTRQWTLAVVCGALLFGACDTTSKRPTSSPTSDNSVDTDNAVGPLGFGQPNPDRLLASALRSGEANDVGGWLTHFALKDDQGRLFVDVPDEDGRQLIDIESDTARYRMDTWVSAYRSMIEPDLVTVRYGNPKNVRNSPPTVDVPVTYSWHPQRVPESRRSAILADVNRLRAAHAALNWNQFFGYHGDTPR